MYERFDQWAHVKNWLLKPSLKGEYKRAREATCKTITFILERISHRIGRFIARQLVTEVLQLLQLFPNVLHGVLHVVVVVVVAGVWATRARRGLLAEAFLLLHHHHAGVRLARGGSIIGLEFRCASRISGALCLKSRGRPLLTPRVVRLIVRLVVDVLARTLALLRFRVCYRARVRVPQRSTASTI